jgi:hypothetical protein
MLPHAGARGQCSGQTEQGCRGPLPHPREQEAGAQSSEGPGVRALNRGLESGKAKAMAISSVPTLLRDTKVSTASHVLAFSRVPAPCLNGEAEYSICQDLSTSEHGWNGRPVKQALNEGCQPQSTSSPCHVARRAQPHHEPIRPHLLKPQNLVQVAHPSKLPYPTANLGAYMGYVAPQGPLKQRRLLQQRHPL